jgi:ferrous-iron efflux pump FieF
MQRKTAIHSRQRQAVPAQGESNMAAPSSQPDRELRAAKLALVVYSVIFAAKLLTYLMTGVMAMMAEALHTLTDLFIYGFLLIALIWSRKAADQKHMFGYGRSQNVAALVAATLFISFTSFELYREAIPRLFQPGEATYQNIGLALGVIIGAMFLVAAPLIGLLRQKTRGAAAKAQLTEMINDELGLLAALIGILFILWGYPIADPIASIVVATIIAWNAIKLFRENASLLLGRAPGPEFQARVEQEARSVPGVLGVHDYRAEYIGPDVVHAGIHIEVSRGLPIEEADRIAEEVERRIHQGTSAGYCVIHVDAAEQPAIREESLATPRG